MREGLRNHTPVYSTMAAILRTLCFAALDKLHEPSYAGGSYCPGQRISAGREGELVALKDTINPRLHIGDSAHAEGILDNPSKARVGPVEHSFPPNSFLQFILARWKTHSKAT